MKNILDLGTGREWRQYVGADFNNHVCVDQLYERFYEKDDIPSHITLIGSNIISFMESYMGPDFDRIYASRVFEHLDLNTIQYALYLMHQICSPKGGFEIIVPDFKKVIEYLNAVDPKSDNAQHFNRTMIMAHTEIFNEPSDPHQSIWTPTLAEYYITLEGYWKVVDIEYTELDKRGWYMKIRADYI